MIPIMAKYVFASTFLNNKNCEYLHDMAVGVCGVENRSDGYEHRSPISHVQDTQRLSKMSFQLQECRLHCGTQYNYEMLTAEAAAIPTYIRCLRPVPIVDTRQLFRIRRHRNDVITGSLGVGSMSYLFQMETLEVRGFRGKLMQVTCCILDSTRIHTQ